MDEFMFFDFSEEMFWIEQNFPEKINQSAFVSYERQCNEGIGLGSNHRNVNMRMMEFLRKSRRPVMESNGRQQEKVYHHMIRERMRRGRQKNGYLALHNLLSPGTKNDKYSIIRTAEREIEDLLRHKEELERRNKVVEGILATSGLAEEAKIKLRVAHPSSGIYSMLEVLKCLKNTGTIIRAIQSNFSDQELSAVLEFETKMGADEVDKAVNKTLFEVERKCRFHFPEG